MKTRQPKYALVLWYSQTGHTQRIGRLISRNWKRHGLKVDAKEGTPFETDWEVSLEDILKAPSGSLVYEALNGKTHHR